MRKVFLARNRQTGFHSLFEIVPSTYSEKRHGVLDMDTFNCLSGWKNLHELIDIIGRTGPMVSTDIYKRAARLIPIADAIEVAEAEGRGRRSQGFCLNEEAFLRMQLYLDGRTGSYPSKASVRRDIDRHGLIESEAVDDLKAWANEDPDSKVAIEPIQDLVVMRNLCSIALRLIANYQATDVQNILEASGFEHVGSRQLRDRNLRESYYVIPFHHDTQDDMTIHFSWKWGRNLLAYMIIDPLERLLLDQRPAGARRYMFGSVEAADYLSSPEVTGRLRPLFNFHFDYENEDTRTYLGICDDLPEEQETKNFIEGLAKMFSSLRNERGELLGWDFDELPDLKHNEGPVPVFHSLASAMVGTLVYRIGMIPATCKNCGDGMFVNPKGKRKQFCSDSCRAQYSQKKARTHADRTA